MFNYIEKYSLAGHSKDLFELDDLEKAADFFFPKNQDSAQAPDFNADRNDVETSRKTILELLCFYGKKISSRYSFHIAPDISEKKYIMRFSHIPSLILIRKMFLDWLIRLYLKMGKPAFYFAIKYFAGIIRKKLQRFFIMIYAMFQRMHLLMLRKQIYCWKRKILTECIPAIGYPLMV